MMRYQSMSQDYLPLGDGRRPNLKLTREEDRHNNAAATVSQSYKICSRAPTFSAFESRPSRIRPGPNPPAAQDRAFPPAPAPSPPPSPDAPGDVLPQWGNKKRSRGPRPEPRAAAADDYPHLGRRQVKTPRWLAVPSPATGKAGLSLRSSSTVRDPASNLRRGVEERPNSKRSPEKMHRTVTRAGNNSAEASNPPAACDAGAAVGAVVEKAELPKIQLTLSRKEKEEDFLLMKFSKLPQRPKKRPKAVEKALQYVYPGMWLSDLSRGRYEVREKKCTRKKKKGLKGMESVDSDSD